MKHLDDDMLIIQVLGGKYEDEEPPIVKGNDNGELETLQPSGGGSEQTPVYSGSGPSDFGPRPGYQLQ